MISQELISSSKHRERGMALLKRLRFLFGILLSAVCIYFLLDSIEHQEVLDRFKNVKLHLLFYAFIATVLSYLLRTIRWRYFFNETNFSFALLFRALILGFFMNNVLPARIGELVRCHSLGRRTGLSRSFVLATVAGERLADGLTISAIFGLFFYFSTLSYESSFYINMVSLAFLVVCILVVIALLIRQTIFKFLHRLEATVNKTSFSYIISKIEKFVSGLEPMLQLRLVGRVAAFSVLVWGIELIAYFLITRAFSENMDIGGLALFLAAVNFSSLIPAAPGGVGVIENFASLALNKAGINYEAAVAMVVAQHSIQYLVVGIPGIFFALRNGKETKITDKIN